MSRPSRPAARRPATRRLRRVLTRVEPVFLRLVGSVLQLVLSVLVAREGGAAVLGQFLVFVAVVNIAISVGGGLPNLLLRHASASADDDPHTGWLWRHSLTLVLGGLLVAPVAWAFGGEYVALVAAGVAGLLLQRVSSSTVKAAGRPGLGVLLDTALWPFLVTALTVLWRLTGSELDFPVLALGYVAGVFLAAAVAVAVSWRLPSSVRSAWRVPRRAPRAFYTEILVVTFGAAAGVVSSNAPLALAPLFLTDAAAGRLGLALRVAGFATTIITALSAHFSPLFARARTRAELRAYRRQSQVACLVLYLPVLLAFVALPTEWLRYLGAEFTGVKSLILILAAGYLVNAATGLIPQLMLMRGRSGDYSLAGVVAAVVGVLGVVLGGWLGGEVGLCIGLSISMVIVNIWGYLMANRAIREAPVEAPAQEPVRAAR